MQVLTRFSLRKAPIIIMLMLLIVAGGIISARQLKSELLPNIDFPTLSVVTIYPGAAPDDVRRDVTEPMEKVLAGTPNLKTLTSRSNDSVSFISAEYEFGTDMEKTQQSIQEAVNRLTLPTQVQRPTVDRFNFQDIPVLAYTINTNDTSPDALVNLRHNLDDILVPQIKSITGVNNVNVAGGGTKEVNITFDEKKLQEKGLTASAVTGVLQANNISFPTGDVVTNNQSIPVRVVNEFTTVESLRNLVVRPEIKCAAAGGATGATGATGAGGATGATGATG